MEEWRDIAGHEGLYQVRAMAENAIDNNKFNEFLKEIRK